MVSKLFLVFSIIINGLKWFVMFIVIIDGFKLIVPVFIFNLPCFLALFARLMIALVTLRMSDGSGTAGNSTVIFGMVKFFNLLIFLNFNGLSAETNSIRSKEGVCPGKHLSMSVSF